MHPRRPLLKRVAIWTAAVVLLLAWYVASFPFLIVACRNFCPGARPALGAVYYPVVWYIERDLPGARTYHDYYNQCSRYARGVLGQSRPAPQPKKRPTPL